MSSKRAEKQYLVVFEEYDDGDIELNFHYGKYVFNDKKIAENFLVEYMIKVPIAIKGRLYTLENEYEKSSAIMDISGVEHD